jgi:hypothetical protein
MYEGELKRGKIIALVVGTSKEKKPVFIPCFPRYDIDYQQRTARFFNPINNGFELKPGEKWEVKIVSWILQDRKTKDERPYLVVKVEVIKRQETLEKSYEDGIYCERLYSGAALIRKTSHSAIGQPKKYLVDIVSEFGRTIRYVISVCEIFVDGNVVMRKITNRQLADDFFEGVRKYARTAEKEKVLGVLPKLTKEELAEVYS